MKSPVPRELPDAFLNASDVKARSSVQVTNFAKRLDYITEIAARIILEGLTVVELDDFRNFLNDLELDVSVNHHFSSGDDITPWIVHTSWTFDLTARELRSELSKTSLSALQEAIPLLNASRAQFSTWLNTQGVGLREAMDSFYCARSFSNAVANLIAMDIILARILTSLSAATLMDFDSSSA